VHAASLASAENYTDRYLLIGRNQKNIRKHLKAISELF